MKRFMTTAATALILSTAAYAEQHTGGVFADYSADTAVDLYASDLLGARIYASENAVEGYEPGDEGEWDDLGEINDMIMNPDGSVQVVILGIGGFLGVGERDVAIQMSDLQIVRDGDDATDYFLVVQANREMIEGAPEFSRGMNAAGMEKAEMNEGDAEKVEMTDNAVSTDASADTNTAAATAAAGAGAAAGAAATAPAEAQMPEKEGEVEVESEMESEVEAEAAEVEVEAEEAMAETENAAEEAMTETENAAEEVVVETQDAAQDAEMAVEGEMNETEMAAEGAMDNAERDLLVAPEIEREGFGSVEMNELTTEDLTGTRVYGPEDEDVGEISELILSEDGKQIEKAVIDVGGFLGMGEHSVAVTLEELRILRAEDGGDFRIYINSSKEALEAQPEYEN